MKTTGSGALFVGLYLYAISVFSTSLLNKLLHRGCEIHYGEHQCTAEPDDRLCDGNSEISKSWSEDHNRKYLVDQLYSG